MATPKQKSVRTTRTTGKVKAAWERGYYSHSYWRGKHKLGTVKLGPKGEWDEIYRWEAGTRQGECATLAAAKLAVEQMIAFGASQISLFDTSDA